MGLSKEPEDTEPRHPLWFFNEAKTHFRASEILEASQDVSQWRNVVFHRQRAIEIALRSTLMKNGIWDGFARDYKKHNVKMLADALQSVSPEFLRLAQLIAESSLHEAPRVGEGPCESSVEVSYAENLDRDRISKEAYLELTEITLATVASECGF